MPPLVAQSFYREKNPKTVFYQVGLGAGTFFAAPRPSYDSIVKQKLPVLSLCLGKRFGSHLTVKSTYTLQPFSSKEYIDTGEYSGTLEPMVSGFANALDIVPMVNLLPSFHHVSRPLVDIALGAGLGYLGTYRTEEFTYNDKELAFNLIENSFYIPIRASLSVKIGKVSDLVVEGAFFHTWLDDNRTGMDFEKIQTTLHNSALFTGGLSERSALSKEESCKTYTACPPDFCHEQSVPCHGSPCNFR